MRFIKGLLVGIWEIARAIAIFSSGIWMGSRGATALFVFLFTIFLIVGAFLVLIGVNLEDADRWLDRQADWLTVLGDIAFRVVFGLILLLCAGTVVMGLYQRLPGRRPSPAVAGANEKKKHRRTAKPDGDGRVGWGAMAIAVIIGYFAAVGTFGRY